MKMNIFIHKYRIFTLMTDKCLHFLFRHIELTNDDIHKNDIYRI